MPYQLANAPEMPILVEYLYNYFQELNAERVNNGFALNRISSTAMRDWSYMYGIELEVWEVKALRRLDIAFMAASNGGDSADD